MKSVLNTMGLSTLVAVFGFAFSGAQAQEISETKDYLQNKSGSVIRTKVSKNCVHRQSWDSESPKWIEGCDGIILAVTAPGAVMFEFNSAELTPSGKAAIDKERQKLKVKMDDGYSGTIVGHTDISGDPNYNIWLSEQRAIAVRNYLLGDNTSSAKVEVMGEGAKYPVASNDTREGRKSNRRVEFVFSEEGR